ncbi:MAG: hypothetical protein KTR15_11870 [Phycisphaeraceae bacterium]|nr:hypothetical protein [Phycisphaeraceae bacterium]
MKKTLAPLFLLLALFVALPAAAQDAEATNLRPKWAVGQSATYAFWGKTQKDEAAQILGQEQSETTTFISEGKVTWRVDAVNDDGSATCTMQLTTITFTIKAGKNEPITMESDNPSGDRPAFDNLMSAMTQTPLTVTVNADGSIDTVEGIDKLTAAAGTEAQDADIIPDELDFKETASDLATLIAAPAGATPGQTWNATNTWNHEDVFPQAETKAKWDTTFTFDSVGLIAGVPIATIKTESQVDIQVDLSELPEGAPDIDIQISNTSASGEVLFDLSRNETVARNDMMKYTAAITVASPRPELPPITVKIVETSQSQLLRVSEE